MSAMPDTPPPPRLAPLLRRSWYHLNQAFRRRIQATGLTPDQFTVLRWLLEHPLGMTQRELADLMASDANTITSLLTRMQAAELIERHAHSSDRRCNVLLPTSKGRAIHQRLQPVASALQDTVLASFSLEDRTRFLTQLALVAQACQDIAALQRSSAKKVR
jgi:DNA-binding MarR family transcriptional regulator